eukprot:6214745-Pleurochrysis_carterae.AAC.1
MNMPKGQGTRYTRKAPKTLQQIRRNAEQEAKLDALEAATHTCESGGCICPETGSEQFARNTRARVWLGAGSVSKSTQGR